MNMFLGGGKTNYMEFSIATLLSHVGSEKLVTPKILEKKAPQPNAMPLSNVIVFDSEPIAKYEPVNNNKYIADFLGISEKQYLKGVLLGELLDVVPGAQKQSIVDKLKIIMND